MRPSRHQRSGRAGRILPITALAAATALALASGSAPRPARPVDALTTTAATTQLPGTLSDTSYQPADFTQQPYVGNGYLSQRLPAIGQGYQGDLGESGWPHYDQRFTGAFVSGAYSLSGTEEDIASIPTWSTLNIGTGSSTLNAASAPSTISGYDQTLDMNSGTVTTAMTWTPDIAHPTRVSYEVLANRNVANLGEVLVSITPDWTGNLSVTGLLDGNGARGVTGSSVADPVNTSTDTSTVAMTTTTTNSGEDDTTIVETSKLVAGQNVAVVARTAQTTPDDLTAGETWTVPVTSGTTYQVIKYVGVATSQDTGDPATLASSTVTNAVSTGWSSLLSQHRSGWAALWSSGVTAADDPALQNEIDSSFYDLYSSIRSGQSVGISPVGLSSDNYAGVIFWDADTWMFPALLAFHPELAKSIVQLRYDELNQAESNATGVGYQGGVWAWANGPRNLCPGYNTCAGYEDHLQNDISLAQWQYYEATGDSGWLKTTGFPVIQAVATYWASRVVTSDGGATYHIDGVTGPDEYVGNVDDDAATDAGAVESLRNAITAANLLGVPPPPTWQQVATGLTDTITGMRSSDGSHPEYQGYTNGVIKQADAILMTYPFGYVADNATAQADLDRYAPVTDPGGPAMTDSVESIIAAQIGRPGCDAYTYLKESVGPFTEGAFDQPFEFRTLGTDNGQGAFDFLTGAGGFLQTFPYGLAGLRWNTAGLYLDPTLPPQLATSGVTISGLRYQGHTVSIAIGASTTTVSLSAGDTGTLTVLGPSGTVGSVSASSPLRLATSRPDQSPTTDLARCKPITSNSTSPDSVVQGADDGDGTTVWQAGTPTANFTIDLGTTTTVSQVQVDSGTANTVAYTVQGSTDDATWTTLADEPSGSEQDTTVTFAPAAERYLRYQEDAPANGPITNGAGGNKCVDDENAATADKNPIDIYDCNSGAQNWTWGPGDTLQVLGKCLDVTNGDTTNGTLVDLYDCNNTGAQVWQARSDGTLVNPQSGRCLDDPAFNTTNYTQLEIWTCNGGANQQWIPGTAQIAGFIAVH